MTEDLYPLALESEVDHPSEPKIFTITVMDLRKHKILNLHGAGGNRFRD